MVQNVATTARKQKRTIYIESEVKKQNNNHVVCVRRRDATTNLGLYHPKKTSYFVANRICLSLYICYLTNLL
jgi:hypothetical protein